MDLRVGSDRPLRGAPRASFTLYLNNPQNLFLLLPRLVSREYCEFFNVARRRKKKRKCAVREHLYFLLLSFAILINPLRESGKRSK